MSNQLAVMRRGGGVNIHFYTPNIKVYEVKMQGNEAEATSFIMNGPMLYEKRAT